MLVRLASVELSILHMALFRWGGPADVPIQNLSCGCCAGVLVKELPDRGKDLASAKRSFVGQAGLVDVADYISGRSPEPIA